MSDLSPHATSAPGSSQAILSSLSALLESNTPLLVGLHRQLGLPGEHLALDLHRIESCLRNEVEAVISDRTAELERERRTGRKLSKRR